MTEESRYRLFDSPSCGTCSVEDIHDEMPRIFFQSIKQGTEFLNHLQGYEKEIKELGRLAESNEETVLSIMGYLHDNYYGIWEEINKEVFSK